MRVSRMDRLKFNQPKKWWKWLFDIYYITFAYSSNLIYMSIHKVTKYSVPNESNLKVLR